MCLIIKFLYWKYFLLQPFVMMFVDKPRQPKAAGLFNIALLARTFIDHQEWPQKWPLLLVVSAKRRYLNSMSLWPQKLIIQPLCMPSYGIFWHIYYWILLWNSLMLSSITTLLALPRSSFLEKVKRWRSDRFFEVSKLKLVTKLNQPKLVSSWKAR